MVYRPRCTKVKFWRLSSAFRTSSVFRWPIVRFSLFRQSNWLLQKKRPPRSRVTLRVPSGPCGLTVHRDSRRIRGGGIRGPSLQPARARNDATLYAWSSTGASTWVRPRNLCRRGGGMGNSRILRAATRFRFRLLRLALTVCALEVEGSTAPVSPEYLSSSKALELLPAPAARAHPLPRVFGATLDIYHYGAPTAVA